MEAHIQREEGWNSFIAWKSFYDSAQAVSVSDFAGPVCGRAENGTVFLMPDTLGVFASGFTYWVFGLFGAFLSALFPDFTTLVVLNYK